VFSCIFVFLLHDSASLRQSSVTKLWLDFDALAKHPAIQNSRNAKKPLFISSSDKLFLQMSKDN